MKMDKYKMAQVPYKYTQNHSLALHLRNFTSSTKRKVLLLARIASNTDLYCVLTTDKTCQDVVL